MRKLMCICVVFLVSMTAFAQKIEKSILDEFTNKPLIATSWTSFSSKVLYHTNYYSSIYGDYFLFEVADGDIFFHQRWITGIDGIDKGAELLLKMTNGAVVTLHATHNFYTSREENTNLEAVYTGDFSALGIANNLVTQMRITTNHGVVLLKLNEKDARKIAKAYSLIQEEIGKY